MFKYNENDFLHEEEEDEKIVEMNTNEIFSKMVSEFATIPKGNKLIKEVIK